MSTDLIVLLPPIAVDAVDSVLRAGGIPLVDATASPSVSVPEGAWVRVLPGTVPGGTGPVVLAGPGDPIPGRPTWLETPRGGPVPEGFAGIVLKGREAGGLCGDVDGLVGLSACPDPGRVILDGGLGPRTAGAAAALGAKGVLLAGQVVACPELGLPAPLLACLDRPEDVLTHVVSGVRVASPVASPVVRRLARGEDPWDLARGLWASGDPADALWMVGGGLAHARRLAADHGGLAGVIAAFREGIGGWWSRAARAVRVDPIDAPPPAIGIGVAWERPGAVPTGGPPIAALAVGGPVPATPEAFAAARDALLGGAPPEPVPAEAIAIVGIGCRLPDAPSVAAYWDNLVAARSSIRDVPPDRWDPDLYWSPDRSAPDKTYARIGAFLGPDDFEPKRFRIPPRVAAQMDPVQRIALSAAYDALVDAGLQADPRREGGAPFDRARCAVILGNSLGGETRDESAIRVAFPALARAVEEAADGVAPEHLSRIVEGLRAAVQGGRPIDEDAMPGELANVIAGRIANALDLGGPNFTVDAACASSLAAVQAAVKGLQDGDFDLAVTGGADRSMDPATYVKFAKIGALSPDHSAPFDASANGFVMGEGAGILVLERYADAVRNGRRIYAIIRGIGASSDGRGKGITAPNKRGQIAALTRAYEAAGVAPGDVDLVEAHGTSTVVGDRVEVESLSDVIGDTRAPERGPIRIGSVKSMIGHLKSAAGAASLIKVALALHHRVLLPSAGFREARPEVPLDRVPLEVQTRAEPWPAPPGGPRRAAVSAFGFGGTNFHVVLEEAQGRPGTDSVPAAPPEVPASEGGPPGRIAASPRQKPPVPVAPARAGGAGIPHLPEGVWAASAGNREDLVARLRALRAGEAVPFSAEDTVRIAGGYLDEEERQAQIDRAIALLEKGGNPDLLRSRGIHLQEGRVDGRIAFLFPGQGSQYLRMGLDLVARYPAVRRVYARADEVLTPLLGRSLTDLLEATGDDALATLTRTEHAQPAVFTLDVALMTLLREHGVTPDAVAGHSLGEYAATVAAGVFTFEQALHAVSARGREMAGIEIDDPGRMVGVSASPERVDEILAGIDGYVIAANRNCPTQTVIAGTTEGVTAAERAFREAGIDTVPLPVSHAFHSAVVAPATEPLRRVLRSLGPSAPSLPITSNVGAVPYPTEPGAIVDLLASQIASPVSWTDQIEALYADGVRIFVEVGPKRALSGFVRSILGRRPHHAVATNHPKRGGVASFTSALAALIALGVPVRRPGAVSVPEIAMDDVRDAARQAGAPPRDAEAFAEKVLPAVRDLVAAVYDAAAGTGVASLPPPRIVCSGASVGLPGGEEVFAPDNVARILSGEGRISPLGDRSRVFLGRGIVRLVKDETGGGSFSVVDGIEDTLRLAGTAGAFDPRDYGLPDDLVAALDRTTQLAIAAALEALRDAGIPLVRAWRETASGKRVPAGWKLPEALRDETGVIFASAFPGYDRLLEKVATGGLDADGRFDRRLLFQILSMGHSQLAQLIGARGPNTQVNAACASTTQAIALAEDWIRAGRCSRVLVIGADDVTTERMLPWIGSGFLAAGAATTAARVEEGALPFDRRRHGLILGMGAVGLVIERQEACEERGVRPLAELLATRIANSAYHGSRLDGDHISGLLADVVAEAARVADTAPAAMARDALFMSHETYTPARGGSASAEADALRAAFGPAVGDVVVANTKGFTGHPMGAGIEDAIALKAMQYGIVPPIANLSEPDPEFRDLHLSRGERRPIRFVVRLAAGFGSQVALAVWRRIADGDDRVDEGARRAWLRRVTGLDHVVEVVEDRTLRVVAGDADRLLPLPSAFSEAPAPAPEVVEASGRGEAVGGAAVAPDRILDELIAVVAKQTGYDVSDLDPEFELEADLGIDTVKQAEILSELRERFGLARDDGFRLADHPTLEALAAYLSEQVGGVGSPMASGTAPVPATSASGGGASAPGAAESGGGAPARSPSVSPDRILDELVAVVAKQTGYDVSDLDPEFELEADLGIDTVKQAEILSELRERFGLARDDGFRLADHPTLEALARYLASQMGGGPDAAVAEPASVGEEPASAPASATETDTYALLADIVARQTGYDVSDLDPEFELEADLGIDTVKQAEILSEVRERLGLPVSEELRLADTPTLGALAGWLADRVAAGGASEASTPVVADRPSAGPSAGAPELGSPRVLPGLPETFRLRRVVPVDLPPAAPAPLSGRSAAVLGEGPVADAVREELTRRGAVLTEPAELVIDCAGDVVASLAAARERADAPPATWICHTALGDPASPDASVAIRDGARAGFTKALGREWPDTAIRVVDVVGPPAEVAAVLCDEASSPGPDEVVVGAGRRGIHHEVLEAPARVSRAEGRVVMLTGGAKGIGRRIAAVLLRRGCRVILVGRTRPGEQPLDEAREKQRIREELAAAGERVTPAAIERALAPLRSAESVREALEELGALGAVRYVAVDLAGDDLETVISEVVAQEGPVDVLVHGAGIEDSRPLAHKTPAHFSRALAAKARGLDRLLSVLPGVRAVGMGSVAGRFGNVGQVDYAAANDAMARRLAAWPDGLCIDWTAWDDVGMATRGGLRSLLLQRGVDLLPSDAGAELAADLLLGDLTGEVVVAGALGGFGVRTGHPLLGEIAWDRDGVVAERSLDPADAPWLADHAIEGVPVLPGVVGLEWMAVVAEQVLGTRPTTASDVAFEAPLKVHPGAAVPTVRVTATPMAGGGVWCTVSSRRVLATGRVQTTRHFHARLGGPRDGAPLPAVAFPDEALDRDAIYARMFHGPRFQVLDRVVGIASDGIRAVARLPADGLEGADRMAPLAIEAAFQAAGLHRWATAHASALPARVGRVERWGDLPRDGALDVSVVWDGVAYDIDVDGPDGPVVRLRGFVLIDRGPVPEAQRLAEPEGGRPACFAERVVGRRIPPGGAGA